MGRTSNIVENPAVLALKWKNEKESRNPENPKEKIKVRETGWYYYDKDQEKEILVDLPLTFIWLETAVSIMGYDEKNNIGIYSNEILSENIKEDQLTVKIGKEVFKTGFYDEIKEVVKGRGGKFCNAVYVLAFIDNDWKIVRFLMTGSSNTAWITFTTGKRMKLKSHAITCSGTKFVESQLGGYEEPVFEFVPLSEELAQKADLTYEQEIEPYFNYLRNS